MVNSGLPRLRVALCLLCGLLSGCSDDGLEKVSVTGTVTIDGQKVPGPGRIYFTPVEPAPGIPTRGSVTKFDAQGNYAAKTFKPGDGLMPGRYQIGIHCWKTPPNMEGKPAISYVAKHFQSASTSGLELEVPSGSDDIEFDIDAPGITQ
jgi:hypothetical protein